jgi:hypothetical protein
MNFFKQRSVIHIALALATSALCFSLASTRAQKISARGLLKMNPSVVLQASTTTITLPCPPSDYSFSRACSSDVNLQVALTSIPKDFHKQPAYAYTVGGGRVVGEGNKVTWDLSGAGPGFYTATVEVHDDKKHRALASVTVTIRNCADCVDRWVCPTMVVNCYDQVKAGTPITCKFAMSPMVESATYKWSAQTSSGEDLSDRISGRQTSISIPTNDLTGQTVYVKVEVKGLDPSCGMTASSSTVVRP